MNIIFKKRIVLHNYKDLQKNYAFSFLNYSKNYFSNYSVSDIKKKLEKEKEVKLYDTNYSFKSEKLAVRASPIIAIITGSAIFLSNLSFWKKVINLPIFAIAGLMTLESLINNTVFIRSMKILDKKRVEVENMWGRKEIIKIVDLKKVENDSRVKQYEKLNNEMFIIVTNLKNKKVYHIPREGVFANEDLFYKIIDGDESLL
jgi:hypothetical protein